MQFRDWRLQKKREVSLTREQMFLKSLKDKLKKVLPICYEIESPASKDFWGSFCRIKKLRDGITHPTRDKTYGANKETNSIFAELFEIDFKKLLNDTESLMEYLDKNC